MDERRAAPLLAPYLAVPALPPAELARVARALERLATEAQLPALAAFYARHRCDQHEPDLAEAVQAVGRTLARLGRADWPGKGAKPCDRVIMRK
jgi:hypothetical protein